MIQVSRTTHLDVPPEAVWQFFREMNSNYPRWHREHLRWRWLQGEPLAPGAIWYADEWIGWFRLSCRFFVTASQPGRHFAFRIGLPHSLVRSGGSFTFAPAADGGCDVTEEFHFGFSAPVLGPVVDLVLRLALPMEDFRRHISEEGDGLVRLLQPGAQP